MDHVFPIIHASSNIQASSKTRWSLPPDAAVEASVQILTKQILTRKGPAS